MKQRLFVGLCTVWVCLILGVILNNAPNIKATRLNTPTPRNEDNPHLRVFPDDLLCDRREESLINAGPSWLEVTIGESTLADVERFLSTLSDDYEFIEGDDNDSRFVIFDLSQRESDIPSAVRLCLVENEIQVLGVTYNVDLSVPRPNLSDFVVQFGEPDAVTWTDNPATRVVFWFEQGIASTVTVLPNDPDFQPTFGRVIQIVYYPFIEVGDYEDRWPYSFTRKFNTFIPSFGSESIDFGPESPFDFDAMIATINRESRRTPTPGATVQTVTPTATTSP